MRKGEETRLTILDQALAEASRVGFEGLTIGNLARSLDMSKSGLFAHFGSKEDLQLELLDESVRRFTEAVIRPALRASRGEPRVRAFFDSWLGWTKAAGLPGGCIFIAAANELDDRPGPLRDRLVTYQNEWLGALARAWKIGVEEGHFRADLDCEQAAVEFYSILLAYHHFSRLIDDPRAGERARTSFERLLADARGEAVAH